MYIYIYICIFFACAALPQPRNEWKNQDWHQRQGDGDGGGGDGGSGAQSSMDRWRGDRASAIQACINAMAVQDAAAATIQHQIEALITTMGEQQNNLVRSLSMQNNQHHVNLVAAIVTAITQANRPRLYQAITQASSDWPSHRPYQAPYQGAEIQGSAPDGGWHWWSAMDMAGHPQTRPVWNGNTNDWHDYWAADAVGPDNTQADADGSNTQAADYWAAAAAAAVNACMPDIPMTGMQMMGPDGWQAAVVPVVQVQEVVEPATQDEDHQSTQQTDKDKEDSTYRVNK
jgi:hypothetical protein